MEFREFAERCFPKDVKRIDSKSICLAVRPKLGGDTQHDIEDVVRLLTLLCCSTVFFATTGTTLKWGFLKYVQDINKMQCYNWSEAICDALTSTFELGKPSGCVIALQVK